MVPASAVPLFTLTQAVAASGAAWSVPAGTGAQDLAAVKGAVCKVAAGAAAGSTGAGPTAGLAEPDASRSGASPAFVVPTAVRLSVRESARTGSTRLIRREDMSSLWCR